MAELIWSEIPCVHGHVGWRRVEIDLDRNGKPYRKTKCEICRKAHRKRHRPKDLAGKHRSAINGALRHRLNGGRGRKGYGPTKPEIWLGCSLEHYITFLESAWSDGMTWENWGTYWEIDHIIPCYKFNFEAEHQVLACLNYENTRPLLKEANQWQGKGTRKPRERPVPQSAYDRWIARFTSN